MCYLHHSYRRKNIYNKSNFPLFPHFKNNPIRKKKKKNLVLDWPGNNPDLNPLENSWRITGDKIAAKNPATKIKLQEIIIWVWYHEIAHDYIQKVIFLNA